MDHNLHIKFSLEVCVCVRVYTYEIFTDLYRTFLPQEIEISIYIYSGSWQKNKTRFVEHILKIIVDGYIRMPLFGTYSN